MAPTDAERLTHLQEQIQQLASAVQAIALKQNEYINVQQEEKSDSDEQDSPLAEHTENTIIELLPEYHGGQSAEELLDWIATVEETLECKRVSLERCVPMITVRFRGAAAAWWAQEKVSRERSGKPRILSWDKLKKKMRKSFLPFNYDQGMFQRFNNLKQGCLSTVDEYATEFSSLLRRVDLQESDQQIAARFVGGLRRQKIRYTLSLLNPLTLAEAHQKALIVEAHMKANVGRERAKDFVFLWCAFGFSLTVTLGCFIGYNCCRSESK
ncbi:unnamed protein product [Microthlaspi erraticum]|uniref:Retrotransposon gag domain-containing protein n=1 Tax=Microthlaspi erraticum TaxID=1685480 RepID=A0A6D2J1Q7_9BRAS|nr:unnamed protein product [Microthlaspi erraticum]